MLAVDHTKKLAEDIGSFTADPYGFVMYNWPWGVPGTPLAKEQGPEDWQRDILDQVGAGVLNPQEAIRVAVASGHGIGKSALVAWLTIWAVATCPDARGVVTANTDTQLRTKTWAELSKWHRMGLVSSWFTVTATAIYSADPNHEKTWRIDAVPWSLTNPEAFAGLHNKGRRVIVVFDEGSTIADPIWETAEGAMTDADTEIIWAVFGNPTRNSGRFAECFPGKRFAHRWISRQIDARNVGRANKTQAEQWVADYGEDSDFVRVRVRGVFPRGGTLQFIPGDIVQSAMKRDVPPPLPTDPLVWGVDVARFGDDESVVYFRKGRDGREKAPLRKRGLDTMALAGLVAEMAATEKPRAIFVDMGGVGGGVVDRLNQLGVPHVFGINFGAGADSSHTRKNGVQPDGTLYANKRAEMWGKAKEWMATGGAIADDRELEAQLTGVEYGFNAHNEILLEKKEDMKKRGLVSPDIADALALTFACPLGQPPSHTNRRACRAGGWRHEQARCPCGKSPRPQAILRACRIAPQGVDPGPRRYPDRHRRRTGPEPRSDHLRAASRWRVSPCRPSGQARPRNEHRTWLTCTKAKTSTRRRCAMPTRRGRLSRRTSTTPAMTSGFMLASNGCPTPSWSARLPIGRSSRSTAFRVSSVR